jgi:methionyl aminopeptidase
MAIVCKSRAEIEKMRRSGHIVREVLEHVRALVAPGVSTMDLERAAEKKIEEAGAKPAFKGYFDYPCVLCTSINQEIVHGIPSKKRVLHDGDVLSLDVGVRFKGYFTDSATTVAIGEVDATSNQLLAITQRALEAGIAAAVICYHIGDIGAAVQAVAEGAGFSVVRDLVGHGIGTEFHEEPQVPNYGKPKRLMKLTPGLTIAIEPMVSVGTPKTRTMPDRWTVVTADGSRAAHFEHTIAITDAGPRILTAYTAN